MSTDFIVDTTAGVCTLTLNRPEHGNAISAAMVPALIESINQAAADPRVRCLVMKANGKHFCAGGDLNSFAEALRLSAQVRAETFRNRLNVAGRLARALIEFPKPVICAIRGAVVGAGLLFALSADFVLSEDDALFVFGHIRVGLSPDAGVTYLLGRLVGPRKALQLTLQATRLGAADAERLGIVTRRCKQGCVDADAELLGGEIAALPAFAAAATKRLILGALDSTMAQQLAAEREAVAECVMQKDFDEGVTAAIEKRPAQFNDDPGRQ